MDIGDTSTQYTYTSNNRRGNTAKWWENVTKKGGSYPRVLPFTARVIREIHVHVLFVNQSRIINAE